MTYSLRSTRWVVLALVATMLAALMVAAEPGMDRAYAITVTSIEPSSDAYLSLNNPDANYGQALQLDIRGNAPKKQSLIKFPLDAVPAGEDIVGAELWVTSGSGEQCADVGRSFDVFDSPSTWNEDTVTWNNAPAEKEFVGGASDGFAADSRFMIDVSVGIDAGDTVASYRLKAEKCSTINGTTTLKSDEASASVQPILKVFTENPVTGDPMIAAAGDIACAPNNPDGDPCQDAETASYINARTCTNSTAATCYRRVLVLGDAQYEKGLLNAFNTEYQDTWGAFRAISQAVPGNHEYKAGNQTGADVAANYGEYFLEKGGLTPSASPTDTTFYRKFTLGKWLIIALDSELSSTTSPTMNQQVTFVSNALAANESLLTDSDTANDNKYKVCVLAFDHRARWSDKFGTSHGDDASVDPLIDELWNPSDPSKVRMDIFLSGHSHNMQSSAELDNNGDTVTNGTGYVQLISGAGGKEHDSGTVTSSAADMEWTNATDFGIVQLDLRSTKGVWSFIKTSDGSTLRTDEVTCNN